MDVKLIRIQKMGVSQGKPVLRDVDREELVKSSGLTPEEVAARTCLVHGFYSTSGDTKVQRVHGGAPGRAPRQVQLQEDDRAGRAQQEYRQCRSTC